jgi:hypothetical protein
MSFTLEIAFAGDAHAVLAGLHLKAHASAWLGDGGCGETRDDRRDASSQSHAEARPNFQRNWATLHKQATAALCRQAHAQGSRVNSNLLIKSYSGQEMLFLAYYSHKLFNYVDQY